MKTIEQRINNIIGQLEGSKKMLADDQRDCLSVLMQFKATKSAISSVMNKIVHEEFDRCLSNSSSGNKEKIEKIFKEIIKK